MTINFLWTLSKVLRATFSCTPWKDQYFSSLIDTSCLSYELQANLAFKTKHCRLGAFVCISGWHFTWFRTSNKPKLEYKLLLLCWAHFNIPFLKIARLFTKSFGISKQRDDYAFHTLTWFLVLIIAKLLQSFYVFLADKYIKCQIKKFRIQMTLKFIHLFFPSSKCTFLVLGYTSIPRLHARVCHFLKGTHC